MTEPFFGNTDLAELCLWLFLIFFIGLVVYLQRENMREGYPLENDDGTKSSNEGVFPIPDSKTFILPHGRGPRTVPDDIAERSELPLARTAVSQGFPMEPVGDPLTGGVGPASWAPRRDVPELDGTGHPKIVPMAAAEGFFVSAGRDPRGLPVVSGDNVEVGRVTDLWIDEPEQEVRYLEYELSPEFGEGARLVPIQLVRLWGRRARVRTLYAHQFASVPTIASHSQITLLEEDKVSAYYAGGILYATPARLAPQLG
ncbi:photosynthetic reaction center subunit H [Limimaricola pyoseonensis]|uniref:Photosynthetic reaction center H subunit n=1 Tax=Limimaricola pyoseonensis TaxID=521013 RepID=A0A1G7B053_9RHOB|nr:photosynthetic reaction center subunit H [Limimaricola pyoseonensis]SDE20459.1 photosynthetic reaction center H subunit [Limimaricola pyoseonensis]